MSNQWNWGERDPHEPPIREADEAAAPGGPGSFAGLTALADTAGLTALADTAGLQAEADAWGQRVTALDSQIQAAYDRAEALRRHATALGNESRVLRPALRAGGDVGPDAARVVVALGAALVESTALTLALVDLVDKRGHAAMMYQAALETATQHAHAQRLATLYGLDASASDDTGGDAEAAKVAQANAALAEALRAAPPIDASADVAEAADGHQTPTKEG